MTKEEWDKNISDYLTQSQEYMFRYGKDIIINLCWSGEENLPYQINVCVRKKRFLIFNKWVLVRCENFATQNDLLKNFKIDGKLLEDLFPYFD